MHIRNVFFSLNFTYLTYKIQKSILFIIFFQCKDHLTKYIYLFTSPLLSIYYPIYICIMYEDGSIQKSSGIEMAARLAIYLYSSLSIYICMYMESYKIFICLIFYKVDVFTWRPTLWLRLRMVLEVQRLYVVSILSIYNLHIYHLEC